MKSDKFNSIDQDASNEEFLQLLSNERRRYQEYLDLNVLNSISEIDESQVCDFDRDMNFPLTISMTTGDA